MFHNHKHLLMFFTTLGQIFFSQKYASEMHIVVFLVVVSAVDNNMFVKSIIFFCLSAHLNTRPIHMSKNLTAVEISFRCLT